MPGAKTTNTAREIEMSILQDISQAKAAPDADLQFLVQLETMVLNHLRSQFSQAAGAMDQAAGAPPAAGPPPMPPPDMSGPPGSMPTIPPGALAGIMGGGGPGGPPPGPPGPPLPPGPPGP